MITIILGYSGARCCCSRKICIGCFVLVDTAVLRVCVNRVLVAHVCLSTSWSSASTPDSFADLCMSMSCHQLLSASHSTYCHFLPTHSPRLLGCSAVHQQRHSRRCESGQPRPLIPLNSSSFYTQNELRYNDHHSV